MSVFEQLQLLASIDLFKESRQPSWFVGRPFYFDYTTVKLLANDSWKQRVGGIPAGAFLLAMYDQPEEEPEAILLRVLGPTPLPSDPDVIAAMVDYYKENVPTDSPTSRLDSVTRYEFQFSGLECRVLGSFYRSLLARTAFGADVDNFYSANNYSVFKPAGRVLEYVVNCREDGAVPGGTGDVRIGHVRYASSRHHPVMTDVPVYVSAVDFLGKRTALFGMTRTGKSNTLKKIVQATVDLSDQRPAIAGQAVAPIGQIIFDINGEYANDNQQDEGTAVYQLFPERVIRYSLRDKAGFNVLKLNFYNDLVEGISLVKSHLAEDTAIYTRAMVNVDWERPDPSERSASTRYERRAACYRCILFAAGFSAPKGFTVRFEGNQEINAWLGGLDPSTGISLEQATNWFSEVWRRYDSDPFFTGYRTKKGYEWADDDLKNLMRFLTRAPKPGANPTEQGFRKLIPLRSYHTITVQTTFMDDILKHLRKGKIVIVDLSQGDPVVQRTYSERLCTHIFQGAMERFVANQENNFIQFYFEEAHNLFPRRDDPDLTAIYNRLAKEGAKLNIGLIYATQEVSSISANVLKNTQNWFVSHLNNADELREIAKYYDFEDFVDSLRRTTDKGFIRMKTYSNPFVVPVQVDRFTAVAAGGARSNGSGNGLRL